MTSFIASGPDLGPQFASTVLLVNYVSKHKICNRRFKQTIFSDALFAGPLRIKDINRWKLTNYMRNLRKFAQFK